MVRLGCGIYFLIVMLSLLVLLVFVLYFEGSFGAPEAGDTPVRANFEHFFEELDMDKQDLIELANGLSAMAFITAAIAMPWILSYYANN